MTREKLLLAWVKKQHGRQRIKRTTEPYFTHLIAVAEMASVIPLGYEIGLCHDLLEDTRVDKQQLQTALVDFGYSEAESLLITNCVTELTDVFTKKAYPALDKKTRKRKEAGRLVTISAAAQTVKYADLIFNINWMLKYDREKAEKYLQRKRALLADLNKGDQTLHARVMSLIDESLLQFT